MRGSGGQIKHTKAAQCDDAQRGAEDLPHSVNDSVDDGGHDAVTTSDSALLWAVLDTD